MVICIAKTLKRNERHTGRIPEAVLLMLFNEYVLALYDQADMAIIALLASQAALFSSSYVRCLEHDSLRQLRIGGMEPAMTEQRVEFVVLIFSHRILTR